MTKQKLFFGFLFFLWIYSVSAQVIKKTHIDSFKRMAVSEDSNTKVKSYLELSNFYSNTNLDSCLFFAKKALVESKRIKNDTVLADVYNTIANAYEYKGQVDSAITFHVQALQKRKNLKDPILIADSYNNLGVSNDQLGKFKESLDYYFKALRIYESENNLPKKAMVLGNIGIVYKQQKSFEKALYYYKKANIIYVELQDDFGTVVTNGNIGSVLTNLHRYEESIVYSEKASAGYEQLKYERYVPYAITNIAIAQDSLKSYPEAEKNYNLAISLHKKYGNDYETANVLNAFATCLIKQKKFKESILASNESLFHINKTKAEKLKLSQLKNLAKANAGLKNFDKAYSYYEKYNQLKDTLFENEKTKSIFELEKLYETEKKEKELANEKVKVTESELRIKQKNTQLIFASGLIFTTFLVGLMFYNQQKTRNRQLKKEVELKEALLEIESQNKLQEQRLAISKDLHDNIGSQLTFIISSLDNLKYFEFTKEKLYDKFENIAGFTRSTITDLRDTIWAMNKEKITFEDLKSRTTNFIEAAKTSLKGIHFEFNIANENNEITLNSLQGIDVYRIIQEAVHNAVKHAKATKIVVSFEKIDHQIVVSILDNGVGFEPKTIEKGNGLASMQKRAQEINAVLSIENQNPGTKVQLKFNRQE